MRFPFGNHLLVNHSKYRHFSQDYLIQFENDIQPALDHSKYGQFRISDPNCSIMPFTLTRMTCMCLLKLLKKTSSDNLSLVTPTFKAFKTRSKETRVV